MWPGAPGQAAGHRVLGFEGDAVQPQIPFGTPSPWADPETVEGFPDHPDLVRVDEAQCSARTRGKSKSGRDRWPQSAVAASTIRRAGQKMRAARLRFSRPRDAENNREDAPACVWVAITGSDA